MAKTFEEIKGVTDAEVEEAQTKYGCTVVSLLPYSLLETKPHMIPFTFMIPAADPNYGFSVLHVEEGLHFIPNPFDEKMNYRQVTSPHEMARSIVEDYSGALIALGEGAGPGLFWVEGKHTLESIKKRYAKKLAEAQVKQERWFMNLVNMADADWEKNHNILTVSDVQRHAARYLNIKKAWVDPIPTEANTCPYCKSVVDPTSIKCFNCKEIINVEAYKAMQAKMGV
tara:strand:- start:264 stop:944 length:681 start_codon:yes stop_codon:yes gene_type:complete